MPRIPLTIGAYSARSVTASCQRSVNLFAEKNPPDSPSPFTYYNAPGSRALTGSVAGPGRGLYAANNGGLYYVSGRRVYSVSPGWTLTQLGLIANLTTPVSMADNGVTLVLVDGTSSGYQIDLTTNVMTPITEAENGPPPASGGVYEFYGADRVDIMDGFMIFNRPGTRQFYVTYDNVVVFDSLWLASKNGYSDKLVSVIVTRRTLALIGERTTEFFFNAGAEDFPFQLIQGAFIQYGCIAKYSIAQAGGAIFWLSQDQAGKNIILRSENHTANRISTHAMENAFMAYPGTSDAVGFCFQIEGHTFYQINFPAADKSWRYDEATTQWHEAVYTGANGAETRHRASCVAYAYGTVVAADYETGRLYALDLDVTTDAGNPMMFRRGYPHLMADGKRVIYPGFALDVEAATSPDTQETPGPFPLITGDEEMIDATLDNPFLAGPGSTGSQSPLIAAPNVWLRWSDDRGRTWRNPVAQSLGSTGQYLTQPQWNRLGMARDRVFEVYGVIPGKLAINGAFLSTPIALAS